LWAGGLATYNFTTLKFELDYAKDLKISSDNKTFTFTLRTDVKWSDGSAVTVDDYQYAFDNATKEDKVNADANWVSLDDAKKITSFKTDKTAGTIVVTLDDVYPSDLALVYATLIAPVPSKVWAGKPFFDAAQNSEILKPTVVNGPYVIDSWDTKKAGVFKPNANWYRGKPNFDQVVFTGGSATVVVESVKTNQADWAKNIPSSQVASSKADSSLNLVEWSAVNGTYRYVEYNTKRAPMDDKAFRSAINYAIDRDNLIKLAEAGLGTAQFSFVNPASPYYNKSVNEFKYNLDTAKKTLSDAGYKLDAGKLLDKTGKAIELTVVFPTSSNPRKLIATYLEQQLKQLGITVKVDGKEFNAYVKQVQSKDFDISLAAAGGGFPDPDSFKANIISTGTQNNTGYSNVRVDEIFKLGAKEVDTAKRKTLYDEAQKLISDDTPVFFLWNINSFSLFSKKVQGVVPNNGDQLYYNDALTRWYYAS